MSAHAELRLDLEQTLNRHVPDMGDRGFTITTAYGDLVIPLGRLACRIADLVEQDAHLKLMRLEASERMGVEP
jgi:hypothetical protein